MRKFMRTCLALALVAAMLVTATGCLGTPEVAEVTVVAEGRLCDKLIYTEYSDGTAVLTGYDGTLTELILPDTVDGLPLVAIADQAFDNEEKLTTLRIGRNIVRIGNEAFYNCPALREVELSTAVDAIGYYAFEGTPWLAAQTDEFVVAGNGILLKYQGNAASVTIPAQVRVLSDAFFKCETLTEVTIPATVERLDGYAFAYCPNLLAVNLAEGLSVIGENAFAFCDNLRAVTIPDSVTTVGPSAFFYCTMLRNVAFGAGVETIGEYAFNYCNHLSTLDFAVAPVSIGDYAFYECYILGGVCFAGKQAEWDAVTVGQGNSLFTDAALHCLGD